MFYFSRPTGVITTKAPPVLIAIIPVAMERYFTKYRGTIPKTAMKTKLKPNPKIPPYVRNIRNKLGTKDVNRRRLALKSEPLATTIRAPKWFVNLPDKGPKRPQPDIAIEPTHAAKEKDILLINQVWPQGNVQPVSPTGKIRFFVTYSTDRVIGGFNYIVGIQLSKGEKISIANKQASNSFWLAFWIVVVFIRQIYLVTNSLSKHERNSYRKFFIGKKSNMRRSVSSLRRESKNTTRSGVFLTNFACSFTRWKTLSNAW